MVDPENITYLGSSDSALVCPPYTFTLALVGSCQKALGRPISPEKKRIGHIETTQPQPSLP